MISTDERTSRVEARLAAGFKQESKGELLRGVDDVRTAVFHPRRFIVTSRFRLFLAQGNGFHLRIGHAHHCQRFAYRLGALLAESQVVFAAAALVGIALDEDLLALVLRQVVAVRRYQCLVVILDGIVVILKVDAALGQRAVGIVQRIDCRLLGHIGGSRRGGRRLGLGNGGFRLFQLGGGAAGSQDQGGGEAKGQGFQGVQVVLRELTDCLSLPTQVAAWQNQCHYNVLGQIYCPKYIFQAIPGCCPCREQVICPDL